MFTTGRFVWDIHNLEFPIWKSQFSILDERVLLFRSLCYRWITLGLIRHCLIGRLIRQLTQNRWSKQNVQSKWLSSDHNSVVITLCQWTSGLASLDAKWKRKRLARHHLERGKREKNVRKNESIIFGTTWVSLWIVNLVQTVLMAQIRLINGSELYELDASNWVHRVTQNEVSEWSPYVESRSCREPLLIIDKHMNHDASRVTKWTLSLAVFAAPTARDCESRWLRWRASAASTIKQSASHF